MARHWDDPAQTDREETASPELTRLLFIAIGVAMLIGLMCGVGWTAYHLLTRYLGG